jgi:hypothetical protein
VGTVTVTSGLPGAVRLTVVGGEGIDHVTLIHGQNEVDEAFWKIWIAENKDYPPVLGGMISGPLEDSEKPTEHPEEHAGGETVGDAEPLPVATPESELPLDQQLPTSAPSVQAEDALAAQHTPIFTPENP